MDNGHHVIIVLGSRSGIPHRIVVNRMTQHQRRINQSSRRGLFVVALDQGYSIRHCIVELVVVVIVAAARGRLWLWLLLLGHFGFSFGSFERGFGSIWYWRSRSGGQMYRPNQGSNNEECHNQQEQMKEKESLLLFFIVFPLVGRGGCFP